MKIYLMRHGEASFDAPYDDVRPLTEHGRLKVVQNIQEKQEELSRINKLITSPVLRAKQTAALTCDVLKRNDQLEEVTWLIHESNPAKAIMALSQYACESVMLFSHQPFASRFVEILCGLPPGEIVMFPASIVAMEADPVAADLGKLLWHLE